MNALHNVSGDHKQAAKEAEKAWDFITKTDDPLEALQALREFKASDLAYVESALAIEAKATGESWQSIADSLGISRQAAWEKYSGAPVSA